MNRIKELRIQKNLTQDEMGKIINVQKSAVSKYELGRAVPSTDVLKKLANYFNVTTDYLLGLSDHPHGEPFAGQSGKNSIDSANQPPAPAGQSGKQSTGGTEGEMEEGGYIEKNICLDDMDLVAFTESMADPIRRDLVKTSIAATSKLSPESINEIKNFIAFQIEKEANKK